MGENTETNNKCSNCVCKFSYRTATPCRYCKWNKEKYWGRREEKMIQDNYRFVPDSGNDTIPF